MAAPRGLLLVTMEAPAGLEEEFNDWYDKEHVPERQALPGIDGASRWVCIAGWPRWLALYDLQSTAVMQSETYLAVSGPRSSPWSLRILPRSLGRRRVVAEALGGAVPKADNAPWLLVARFAGAEPAAVAEACASLSAGTAAALFREIEPASARGAVWALIPLARPVAPDVAGDVLLRGPAGPDVLNLYRPYHRD